MDDDFDSIFELIFFFISYTSLLGTILISIITLNCLQMKAFFERSEAGTSENARKQAIERTQANIDWLKKYEETITKWLETSLEN